MTVRDLALQTYLSNPTAANRNALIAHHHNLVHLIVRKRYRIPDVSHDDAFQEGILGLYTAIARFDPAQGKFSSYAAQWISASIKTWLEREIKQVRCAPMKRDSRYQDVPSQKATIRDMASEFGRPADTHTLMYNRAQESLMEAIPSDAPGPFEQADACDTKDLIRRILPKVQMNEREKALIQDNILNDVPMHEVAAKFGVSKQRMSQIKLQLMQRLEGEINQELR